MRGGLKYLLASMAALAFQGGCSGADAPPSSAQQASTEQTSEEQTVESSKPAPDTESATRSASDATIWVMDAGNSYIKFSALQEGHKFTGSFKTFAADIVFSPDKLAASSVRVAVPLSGVDAGSTDRNSSLPAKTWFSVKKFPEAVYTASNFAKTDDGQYEAQGELTLKGISKPLTLPFTLDFGGRNAVMRGAVEMNRTDWNIGEKPWNTDEWVSTAVTLDIQITAIAQ